MGKKIVFLVGCLIVALLCSVPQVVSAYDHTDGYDEELIVGSDAEEPEYDDEESDEDEGYEQDGDADEEGGEYEEEGYNERQ